jgi:hypothetical protein
MKKKIAVLALMTTSIVPANADVYVKVDANGNAIGGAIVCEASVCGNSNSAYSRATLNSGEQYVLQGFGTVGIGNNNPDTTLKVDKETQVWTVTTPTSVSTFTPESGPSYNTAITDTATVLSDTATAVTDTATATATSKSITLESLYAQVMALLTQILALIAKLNG